ncbi:Unknown protein sequence [Pseudomonas coronafaciens pv. oryzae]|nr:Unknown protein sequence [Pseudomonas coronafaciens pv. oryzae]
MGGYEWHKGLLEVAAYQGQLIAQTAMEGETGGGEDRNGLSIADRQGNPGQGKTLLLDEDD